MNQNDKRINAYQKVASFQPVKLEKMSQAKDVNPVEKLINAEEDSGIDLQLKNNLNSVSKKNSSVAKSIETKPQNQPIKSQISIQDLIDKNGLLKTSNTTGINKNTKNDSGESQGDSVYRRVAKFLLLIGVNEAAKILPHLEQDQIEKIVPEIASVRSVSPEEATVIFAEFKSLLQKSKDTGGVDTARSILEKAFGPEKASSFIEKTVPYPEGKPFEYLQEIEGERLYFLLKDESAPMQALVLSRLKPTLAADTINHFSPEQKKEVIIRLAKLPSMNPDVVRRVDHAMHEKYLALDTSKTDSVDGRGALVEILRKMDPGSEQDILITLGESDPDLGHDLRERLFTIDDVVNADDRFIQHKLQIMEDGDIALLISDKTELFRKKILSNVSKGRGDIILEEEQLRKPILKRDCDQITNIFFSSLRRAWEEGKLIISGRDGDIYV